MILRGTPDIKDDDSRQQLRARWSLDLVHGLASPDVIVLDRK